MDLGKQIKQVRISRGMTQAELADHCKVDVRTIQRIEQGKVTPRLHTLKKLNEVLETDFEYSQRNSKNGSSFWLWLTVVLSVVFVILFFPIVRKTYDFGLSVGYTIIGLLVIWLVFAIRKRIFSAIEDHEK